MQIQPFITVEYYKKAIHKSVATSVLTVCIAFLAMALVSGIHFVFRELPVIENSVQQIMADLNTHYPEELIFEWSGMQLTANTESITVPWPEANTIHSDAFPKQFLFYTNSQQTPVDLNVSPNEYLAFVNTQEIYRMDSTDPQKWISEKLEDFIGVKNPTTIDKTVVTQLTQTTMQYMQTYQLQIKLFTLLLFALLFLGSKLWFLCIETVLAVLLFKLYAIKLSAKQTVLLSFHVLVPAVVLTTIANLLYQDISFPIQTVTFWILILYLSFQFKQAEEEK